MQIQKIPSTGNKIMIVLRESDSNNSQYVIRIKNIEEIFDEEHYAMLETSFNRILTKKEDHK